MGNLNAKEATLKGVCRLTQISFYGGCDKFGLCAEAIKDMDGRVERGWL